MHYRLLGRTGLAVSRLSLGTMTFTDSKRSIAAINKVDPALADRFVGRALDAGINFFDTADVYDRGDSEVVLGRALGKRRKDVVITTKVGNRAGRNLLDTGLSRRHILQSVDESLARLGTDWIDVYVAHVVDPVTPLEETLDALDSVVRAGKVRYLAFSNWPAWQAAASIELQRAHGWAPFTHGQMFYSLACRDVERDMVPMMARYGLGLTVWSPLAFGLLSGRINADNIGDAGTRFADGDMLDLDKARAFAVLRVMQRLARDYEASVAQIAFAWLLAKPAVTSVLIGASRIEQLDDNIAAGALRLSDEDIAELDAVTVPAGVYPYAMNAATEDRKMRKALTEGI